MRSTIHLVSKRDYWPFALGIRKGRREWYLRVAKTTADRMEEAAAAVRLSLKDGPVRQAELYATVDPAIRHGIDLPASGHPAGLKLHSGLGCRSTMSRPHWRG